VSNGIVRDPFQGNIIPSGRINPAVPVLLPFIPPPNATGTVNNFATSPLSTTSGNLALAKVDYEFGPKDRIFFTGMLYRDTPASAGPYSTSSDPKLQTEGLVWSRIPTQNGTLGWSHTLSPTTLLNMRLSDSWKEGIFDSPTVAPGGLDLVGQMGIDPANGGLPYHAQTPGIPTVSILGFTGTAGLSHFPTGWRMNQALWSTNMSTLRGKHSLQFGYALRYWKGGFFAQGDHRGNWSFNGSFSNSPGIDPVPVNGLADFLLGYPYNSSRTAPWNWFYFTTKNHWLYIQDSYKVNSHLTLNYGLRYEYDPWPVEKYGQFMTFSPQGRGGQGILVIPSEKSVQPPDLYLHPPTEAWMQLFTSLGTVTTADKAGIPQTLREMPKKDFAPRVGFAWQPRSGTLIRGGYGIYFLPADFNHNLPDTGISPPFLDRTTPLLNTYPVPVYNMQNSYCRSVHATFPGECVAGDPFSFPAYPGIETGQINEQHGYVQQWNLDVQRTFATYWLLDVGYIANAGHHLEGGAPVNNPFPGLGDIQPRRPYPDFGTIQMNMSRYNSEYHSLQVKVQRQFAKGLSLLSAFTWSRTLDDLSDAYGSLINPYFPSLNRSASDFDAPLRFVTSYIWDLPIPQRTGPSRYLVNGWRLTGILSAQSGYPYTVNWAGDPMNTGAGTVPDRVCSGKLNNPTPQAWYDLSCFVSPPVLPGTNGLVTSWGNSGRNILREDRLFSFDAAIFKDFNFSDRFRAQFRCEAFNLTNTVSFGPPGTTSYGWGGSTSSAANTPGANQVLGAASPRVIQLGLKLIF
jgi:hypothetical protein